MLSSVEKMWPKCSFLNVCGRSEEPAVAPAGQQLSGWWLEGLRPDTLIPRDMANCEISKCVTGQSFLGSS